METPKTLLIDIPGTFLHKKSRRVIVETPDGQSKGHSLLKLKEIIFVGRGISFSTDLLFQALRLGVKLNFLDRQKRAYAHIVSPFATKTIAQARAQFETIRSEKARELSREIVLGKISNQEKLLSCFQKNGEIDHLINECASKLWVRNFILEGCNGCYIMWVVSFCGVFACRSFWQTIFCS